MRIRQLGSADVEWLVRSPGLFDEPADREAARAYLSDPSNLFLLAIENRGGVGFLRGTSLRQVHTQRPQMFLYEIAVLPEHRRRGIAKALIERMLRYCRQRSYDEAFVLTSPTNRAAVRLYRSTGGITETDADRMFVYRFGHGRRAPATPRSSPSVSSALRPRQGAGKLGT